jgi:hypothetical protein
MTLYVPALVAGVANVKLVLLPYVVEHDVALMYAVILALNPVPVTVTVSPPAISAAVALPGYAIVVAATVALTPLTVSTGPSAVDCSVVKLCAIFNSNNFQPYVLLL